MTPNAILRGLIVGTGSIGQRHMRNLRNLVPDIELLLLRRSSEPLQGWPNTRTISELSEALKLEPDFAILATPSAHHISVLPTLIVANVPTYVEKPIVTSPNHIDQVRAALMANPGVSHKAGFNLRLIPSIIQAAKVASSGLLGHLARASFSAGQWLPDWRPGKDHREIYSARTADGGGVLLDLSHEFDIARLLVGEMNIEYTAQANVKALQIDSVGAAIATARAMTGTLVSINLDYVARQPLRRYELIGTEGSLTWDLSTKSLTLTSPRSRTVLSSDPTDFDVGATYVTAMASFLEEIQSGKPGPLQNLEDGMRSTELAVRANMRDFRN